MRRLVWALVVAVGCAAEPPRPVDAPPPALPVVALLSGDATGFARADRPHEFTFPADHGPHPEFRTEWWYFTGHLETSAGRRFGYQLTLFRNAISPDEPTATSAWATRQVYMGHLAVTDVEDRRFHSFERFSRGALNLAGAQAEPVEAWIEDWRIEGAGGDGPPFRLTAGQDDVAIDLTLEAGKPIVLQGVDGLSQKGSSPGNASYYFSLTRMPTAGRVTLGTESFEVTGTSWMDREWSSSALEENQIGWDWFSLQLADGTELMYYRLRERGGTTSRFSAGSYIGRAGETARLAAEAVTLEELETWTSPGSGIPYPARWRLKVPSEGLDLTLEPLLADQEWRHSFHYWEGAVRAEGRGPAGQLTGQGYVELTGYQRP